MKLTNPRNLFIYRWWSLIYDSVFDRLFASSGRRRALEVLDIQAGEQVLLVGIGTGADLPLLPQGTTAIGVDLSREMLGRASQKLSEGSAHGELIQGDVQYLPLAPASFDCAILNLILSVVPSGSTCLREAIRILKAGGRVLVFDKFVPDEGRISGTRRFLNQLTTLFGTDITRRLGELMEGTQFIKIHDEPSLVGGGYRIIVLEKPLIGSPV